MQYKGDTDLHRRVPRHTVRLDGTLAYTALCSCGWQAYRLENLDAGARVVWEQHYSCEMGWPVHSRWKIMENMNARI